MDFSALVVANRILANEGVVDAYGHVSMRDPGDPERFFLARSLAPQFVEAGDIMQFDLEGNALGGDARQPYLERFIHAAIFAARPDVMAGLPGQYLAYRFIMISDLSGDWYGILPLTRTGSKNHQ